MRDASLHHILLVDDDEELRDLTRKYLERNGYRVSSAGDGWDAIREIVVTKPDLVVMDIEMPKLSGLNALDILRVSRLTEQLPVIVTSAHGDKDTILRSVQLGADDFIVKPYAFSELVTRIRSQLFTLNFEQLKTLLSGLGRPSSPERAPAWNGPDTARYQDWGAYAGTYEGRELCVLLHQGLTLEQAPSLDLATATKQVLVLARNRSGWKCVWPLPDTAQQAPEPKAA